MLKTKTTINTKISECSAFACAYNHTGACRADEISLDGPTPRCDVYLLATKKYGIFATYARVSRCSAACCLFNNNLECEAEEIPIMLNHDQPVCAAYQY